MRPWQRKPETENPWQKGGKKAQAQKLNAMAALYAADPEQAIAALEDRKNEMVAPGATQELQPTQTRRRGRPVGSKNKGGPKDPAERKKNKTLTERFEQKKVVVYCEKAGIPFFAIPNAARRTIWEAMEAKRAGMKAGIYDLCFPVPMQGKGGLWIEMKRIEGGVVSPMQKYWGAFFRENNFRAEIAHGAEAAIAIIDDYFAGWKGLSNDLVEMLQKINLDAADRKLRLSQV